MRAAVSPTTIRALAALERELAAAQRSADAEAVRDALAALVRRGWLTTGQAAEQLGVSIPTVKDWIRRGTLAGQPVGGRWYVSEDSVQKVVDVRQAIANLDKEGYPTEEEIRTLTRRVRRDLAAEQAKSCG